MAKRNSGRPDPALANFQLACKELQWHPLLGPLYSQVMVLRQPGETRVPKGQWAAVTSSGHVLCHPTRLGRPDEWMYAISHCLLHLGLGHLTKDAKALHDSSPAAWNLAADLAVERFLDQLKVGHKPGEYDLPDMSVPRGEAEAFAELRDRSLPERSRDLIFDPSARFVRPRDFQAALAKGIRQAVSAAIAQAAGAELDDYGRLSRPDSDVARARAWFIASYPLLGALAASFELVEDRDVCRRVDIRVAAVDAYEKRIYFNPLAALSFEECKFVMAHEFLHVALRHFARCGDRDPYVWNCATDYAINLWLEEMGVGDMPRDGLLLDHDLKGLSAESIYDKIVKDVRVLRRLKTFRDTGKGDILDAPEDWWSRGQGVDLDAFYRQALAQGLTYHRAAGRGLLPAGLEEEIRAQTQPPIPWEVKLGDWFDAFFPPVETRRSYHRPSRRQSATPDIPRPRVIIAENALDGRTFGVVLDTSLSMDRVTLARALGSIASYAMSREVPAVRVVFCDAAAHDAGYMPAEDIAGRVKVKGRGGTVLQPGVELLRSADDFPADAPILIVTDAECEPTLRVPGEHAFLVPFGRRLPFPAKGPVFTMDPSRAEC